MTRRTGVVVVAGLLLALVLAGVASSWASDSPDGLESVASTHGLDEQAREQDLDTPFSGYSTDGVDDSRWSTGVAGIAGVGVSFVVFAGLTLLLRRRGGEPDASE